MFQEASHTTLHHAVITQINNPPGQAFSEAFKALQCQNTADAHYDCKRGTSPCAPGTRIDILREIRQWAVLPTSSPICWLFGMAGSGKSAIARSFSENIAKDTLLSAQQAEPDVRLAASFFFKRQINECCDTNHVVATIAYQLATTIPDLKSSICDVIAHDPTILTDKPLEDQLKKLVIKPLQSLSQTNVLIFVFVIDALDECRDVDRMVRLITLLVDTDFRFRLRVFITSRPEPRIVVRQRDADLCYDLRAFNPDEDIRLFLTGGLRSVRQVRNQVMAEMPPSWPSENDIDILVTKSSGLFIYAATVFGFIKDEHSTPHTQLAKVLNNRSAIPGLDQLYIQILSDASSDIGLLRKVVGIILLIRTPLSARTLEYLFGIEAELLCGLFEKLHSILTLPDFSVPGNFDVGRLGIFHLSLHDFLTSSEERAGDYFIDSCSTNADLVKCCLRYINATLPRCWFTVPHNAIQARHAVAKHLQERNVARRDAIRYACLYWSYHLCHSRYSPHRSPKGLRIIFQKFSFSFVFPWCIFIEMDAKYDLEWGSGNMPEAERERERELWLAEREAWLANDTAWEELCKRGLERLFLFGSGLLWAFLLGMPGGVVFMLFSLLLPSWITDKIDKVLSAILLICVLSSIYILARWLLDIFITVGLQRVAAHRDVDYCVRRAGPWVDVVGSVFFPQRTIFRYSLLKFYQQIAEHPLGDPRRAV